MQINWNVTVGLLSTGYAVCERREAPSHTRTLLRTLVLDCLELDALYSHQTGINRFCRCMKLFFLATGVGGWPRLAVRAFQALGVTVIYATPPEAATSILRLKRQSSRQAPSPNLEASIRYQDVGMVFLADFVLRFGVLNGLLLWSFTNRPLALLK